jgi:hypothetical protein
MQYRGDVVWCMRKGLDAVPCTCYTTSAQARAIVTLSSSRGKCNPLAAKMATCPRTRHRLRQLSVYKTPSIVIVSPILKLLPVIDRPKPGH